ncbi:unnamed protein product [Leptosia nina]|uniref:Uncharacterized protein n=1 Tax=Leptosia nina TaxID=320188 RepID=A0AAV1IVI3_9NEOP
MILICLVHTVVNRVKRNSYVVSRTISCLLFLSVPHSCLRVPSVGGIIALVGRVTDGKLFGWSVSKGATCGPAWLRLANVDTGKTAGTESPTGLAPQTGGADSASGGSGGSGMECMQLRSTPGPFHYPISEQTKSLVALQELQHEVGALLEFRDLVIETFPNLRSKMAPSTPASTRRDWEPGVRVRRKLAASGDPARAKPQPSVQDSGFSTETSCSKDAHSSASASAATRSRPVEDELWALLDVIQRKGSRLRDEAELLRGELDERQSETAEESFARQLSAGCADSADILRLRSERDALLARAAQLEALAASSPPTQGTPLGRLDSTLDTPRRPPRIATPDSKKFAAILQESNPVELRRQLLVSTVQNQLYSQQLKQAAAQRTRLLEKLDQATDLNKDLKFRLDEKSIELDLANSRLQQYEKRGSSESLDRRDHSSMRDMEPLNMPDEEAKITETPRRKPSKIPLHTAHKGAAPRPPAPVAPPRPSSAHSSRSVRSTTSSSNRKSSVPVRRPSESKVRPKPFWNTWFTFDRN